MTQFSKDELVSGVLAADQRAIARSLTLIEDGAPLGREVLAALYAKTGRAQFVGVTGAPGAGKSTLVDQLALGWRRAGKRIGILAVDPTSPFSGGAILGDRVRMVRSSEDEGVFIRSMATRGALGGVARATVDAATLMDAAGFDIILIETVGVGQAEVDIVRLADTCLVILVPGMGDSVQAMKAGILEIADVFVINKADRPGVDILHRDLKTLLSLTDIPDDDWRPSVRETVAVEGKGIAELIQDIEGHRTWLQSSMRGEQRRRELLRALILERIQSEFVLRAVDQNAALLDSLVDDCLARRSDPVSAAQQLWAKLSTS